MKKVIKSWLLNAAWWLAVAIFSFLMSVIYFCLGDYQLASWQSLVTVFSALVGWLCDRAEVLEERYDNVVCQWNSLFELYCEQGKQLKETQQKFIETRELLYKEQDYAKQLLGICDEWNELYEKKELKPRNHDTDNNNFA
jgi:predicted O-linked N-acetylglucosamine transferase (SPINDLY family)